MAAHFGGSIDKDVCDSEPDWEPFLEPRARPGAPNVLFVVWDDMGYGSWDSYGGLIEMPNMTRIAQRGVRFSQFHTTALCSPSRAALLTGRNAQSNGMGTIGEMADGFPGLSCVIPQQNAFLSEILREQGYNTFAVGKWHLSPASEMSMGGSKRTWPLSRGFDRFYGFLGGLTDQWYPDLTYDNHPVEPPARPEDGYHLSSDLADKTIEFLQDSAATAPGKPWFTYFAPGAGHTPHHVFTAWADKYAGRFSMGYEKYREVVLENQKRLGLLPADTQLPPVNPYADVEGPAGLGWNESDLVQPWDSLSADEKRLFERQAEVFAGFASYTDAQFGRILDFLEETDQLDNTLIVVVSDNGASGEGGPMGSVNGNRWYNGIAESLEENLRLLPELGLESTCPHYANGWAMAFNTPFKMYKTYSSFEGGVADPLIVSWPAGIPANDEIRDHYVHVSDIVPTVLDCLGLERPEAVRGLELEPFEGLSFHRALVDPAAETDKHEQFYAMLGTRGVWSDGWHASAVHPPTPSGWSQFDQDEWELYHLPSDRNQLTNLADSEPARLEELKQLWDRLARQYNGYPLDDRNSAEILAVRRPDVGGQRTSMVLRPGAAPVPEHSGVELVGRSFTIVAELDVDPAGTPEGVVYALGGRFGGHALFVQDGALRYVYNWLGELEQHVVSEVGVPTGRSSVGVRYVIDGYEDDGSPHGTASMFIDDAEVGSARIKTQPGYFALAGEGATAGRDVGQAVSTSYRPPYPFTGGRVGAVVVDVASESYRDTRLLTRGAFARD